MAERVVCLAATVVVLATASCGRIGFDATDAAFATDGPATRQCWPAWRDGTIDFDSPRHMAELDFVDIQGDPSLTADDLRLYFRRENGATGVDVMTATRQHVGDLWNAPALATELQTAQDEARITVALDGLSAVVATNRPGGLGGFDFWLATRENPSLPFNPPMTSTLLDQVNDSLDQYDPELAASGLALYLAPDDGTGNQRIARSTRASPTDPFGAPIVLPELGPSADPTLSPDELVIVFTNFTVSDLYYATRAATTDAFGAPKPVPVVNTAMLENDPELSLDGCELFFRSPRTSIGDLMVATAR